MSDYEIIDIVTTILSLVMTAIILGCKNQRQEEIKAKPPSIAKWLAAYPTFIRGEKPYQKRHPFLPLLYHIIRRVSTWFCHSFFIYGQHYLYREEEIKSKTAIHR